jgi:hypothetical protein
MRYIDESISKFFYLSRMSRLSRPTDLRVALILQMCDECIKEEPRLAGVVAKRCRK